MCYLYILFEIVHNKNYGLKYDLEKQRCVNAGSNCSKWYPLKMETRGVG